MSPTLPIPVLRYGAAVFAVMLALALTLLLPSLQQTPFLLFLAAAVAVSCWSGLEAGLLAVALSALAAAYFFLHPANSLAVTPEGALVLAAYVLTAALVGVFKWLTRRPEEALRAAHQVEQQLRDREARLEVLSRQLIAAQETECRHLARELHDEIGQALTGINLYLQFAREASGTDVLVRLDQCLGVVRQAIQQVRNLSLNLRPPMLDDFGLEAALRWYVDQQGQQTGLVISLQSDLAGRRFPPDLETACFRVTQAALTNAVRHARAGHVWIEVRQGEAVLVLQVRDDGVWFDVAAAHRRALRGESFGLLGMEERVELLGGQFAIASQPGQGAIVRARFPLPAGTSPSQ